MCPGKLRTGQLLVFQAFFSQHPNTEGCRLSSLEVQTPSLVNSCLSALCRHPGANALWKPKWTLLCGLGSIRKTSAKVAGSKVNRPTWLWVNTRVSDPAAYPEVPSQTSPKDDPQRLGSARAETNESETTTRTGHRGNKAEHRSQAAHPVCFITSQKGNLPWSGRL